MKVNVNGQQVDATQLSFSAVIEPWAEYKADDGSTIRIKVVLTKLFKCADKNPDGSTIYSFQCQTIMAVDEKES